MVAVGCPPRSVTSLALAVGYHQHVHTITTHLELLCHGGWCGASYVCLTAGWDFWLLSFLGSLHNTFQYYENWSSREVFKSTLVQRLLGPVYEVLGIFSNRNLSPTFRVKLRAIEMGFMF